MVCIYLIKVSMMREVKRVLKSMIMFITELSFIQKKKKKKKSATSTTILQYFYNKSWVVSYYWFKFEFSIEITFLTQQ